LDECSRCHSETLEGGDFGPPVVGTAFWEQWNGKTLSDVFASIRETMPQDNPGRLSPSQTADVVAFLMKKNGFPSGDAALSSDTTALQTIGVTPTR
jgi:mono/diheme cytochrome c family protein